MAIVKDLKLPEELKEELHRTVALIPPSALVELVGRDKAFAPGIRATESAAEHLRKRLQSMIDSPALMPSLPLETLRQNSFQQRFVCVLSEMALTDPYGFASLSAFCGGARLLVGMLLDPRPKVSAKAIEFIRSGEKLSPPPADSENARKALHDEFGPFIDELSQILLAPKIKQAPASRPEKHKDLDTELRKTNAKLTHQIETLHNKLEAERQRAIDAKKAAESNRRESDTAISRMEKALKEIEDLKKIVATKTDELEKAIKTAKVEKNAKSAAVETANRTRAIFSSRLAEKDGNVKALKTELSQAMEKIAQLEKSGATDTKEQFAKAIEKSIPTIIQTPRSLLSGILGHTISPNDKPVFLIDGHNVINSMPQYVAQDNKGMKHEELRNLFIKDVCEFQRLLHPCELRIHFDGPKPTEHTALGNNEVKIVYSGGSGDHRADKRILQYVDFLALQANERITAITVSDDSDLRDEAAQSGSLLLYLNEFFSLF